MIPADIITAAPSLWPFANHDYYKSFARPLSRPLVDSAHARSTPDLLKGHLKIHAIFVFNDPRDWALDTQLIMDLVLSNQGYLGTVSPHNGNPKFPNRGFQRNSQPLLFFSNPDLQWAAGYHLPRIGQGGFIEAVKGVWKAITGEEETSVKFAQTLYGKPYRNTYKFAEERLIEHRRQLNPDGPEASVKPLQRVYMIGGGSILLASYASRCSFLPSLAVAKSD